MSENDSVTVLLFAMPDGACSYEKSWAAAAHGMEQRLTKRIQKQIQVKFIEIFSKPFFEYPDIVKGFQNGKFESPLLIHGDDVIQSGGKVSEKNLREYLTQYLKSIQ